MHYKAHHVKKFQDAMILLQSKATTEAMENPQPKEGEMTGIHFGHNGMVTGYLEEITSQIERLNHAITGS